MDAVGRIWVFGWPGLDLLFRSRKGTWHMRKFASFAVDFLKREDGPTAVEYAVMLALIIVVCIAAIATLGSNANTTFSKVGSAVGTTGS
jgi:pilus assembly protein Flp/PilA